MGLFDRSELDAVKNQAGQPVPCSPVEVEAYSAGPRQNLSLNGATAP